MRPAVQQGVGNLAASRIGSVFGNTAMVRRDNFGKELLAFCYGHLGCREPVASAACERTERGIIRMRRLC
jgi:hypothetical protein